MRRLLIVLVLGLGLAACSGGSACAQYSQYNPMTPNPGKPGYYSPVNPYNPMNHQSGGVYGPSGDDCR